MIVLDASALLAFMFRESGHRKVAEVIEESCISTVNLAEVIGRFVRDGHDSREVLEKIERSPIEIVPFFSKDAALSATLIPATKSLGLSFGDRACLALAAVREIPALTADRAWRDLDLDIAVEIIR